MKRWILKRTKVNTKQMADELGIREATACVLANRGITERRQAATFLKGQQADMAEPFLMKDMEKGVGLIATAIREKKHIAVYGDYDVDGVMSTVILYRSILRCGGKGSYYLPHRQQEGYGLNVGAIEMLAKKGVEVLFTCDNGIAAIEEVKRAKELGMTVVILDHHEPGFVEKNDLREDILPEADAIIDPKQQACGYPFPMLCAGGLAYKFAGLLLTKFAVQEEGFLKELLCFGAIATVCDIVDLLDENRILVRQGLVEIEKRGNLGLRMLIEETGLQDKKITEYHLGFIIGPCINATGRLESGAQAVELFCEEEEKRAREIACSLLALNEERKNMTAEATKRAMKLAESMMGERVLVLYDPNIHESIAGIVAGRMKEQFYRPTILITGSAEGAKGSGRSIAGYHLFDALSSCKDLFTRFGGHAMAAGLSLPVENIGLLRKRLNEACTLQGDELIPVLFLDKQLAFGEIDLALAEELKGLSPFGKENHAPLFGSKAVVVDRLDRIGKNKDILRFMLREESSGIRLPGISFDGYGLLLESLKELYPQEDCDKIIDSGKLKEKLDIVYSVEVNEYNDRRSVQLMIKDFRFAK